jgi:hypothetical protein
LLSVPLMPFQRSQNISSASPTNVGTVKLAVVRVGCRGVSPRPV